MDRSFPRFICELCGKTSGRARFAARRGRGIKDHGRAQETVVIGNASALHRPSLSSSWVGRGLVQRWRRRVLRLGAGLIGGGLLPGVRGRATFTQSRLLCSLRGSALRSVRLP